VNECHVLGECHTPYSLKRVAAPYKKQLVSRVIGDQSKSADPSNYPPYFLWQIYP